MKSAFAKALSRLRREKGLSQRGAAADLGVSQALLSHYENDAREPKLDFVIKACDYYGVTADYLLGRTDEREVRALPVPQSCEGAARLVDSTGAVFEALDRFADQELYSSVVDFLVIPIETVFMSLHDPDAPYDPKRDAELKIAESALLLHAKRVAEKPAAGR